MRAMRRRLTAWICLCAMLAGVALPAHAYTHLRHSVGGTRDLCTSSTGASQAPAAPSSQQEGACDACCGCGGGAAFAAPVAQAAMPVALVASLRAAPTSRPALFLAHFQARAPPRLA
jgi:hypothetical protein